LEVRAFRKERLEASATDFVVRLAFLFLFARWSLELVRLFVAIVIWAILLAVALYSVYAGLERRLGDRCGLAALLTLVALATVLGPVSNPRRKPRRVGPVARLWPERGPPQDTAPRRTR
jgi:predicted PurR-regulated permease PerM